MDTDKNILLGTLFWDKVTSKLNKQVFTFSSINGCKVDTNDLLLFLFFLNLQFKFVAAQFN